jgi:hypothetical protein
MKSEEYAASQKVLLLNSEIILRYTRQSLPLKYFYSLFYCLLPIRVETTRRSAESKLILDKYICTIAIPTFLIGFPLRLCQRLDVSAGTESFASSS